VTDVKYIVKEPQQSKLGGWFCQVINGEDKTTLLYETFQQTKNWAFRAAVEWLDRETDGKLVRLNEESVQTVVNNISGTPENKEQNG
jgi:hypothetical protein